jgi:predicted GNAT family acetyltransferase
MRANEFITEDITPELTINHKPTDTGGAQVQAYMGNREVGFVQFQRLRDGNYKASMAHVSPSMRKQGIGREMYRYARNQLGFNIVPSDSQSDDAKAFWARGGATNEESGVTEAFDQPYRSKWEKSEHGDYDALVRLPDGTNLSIMFNNEGDDEWQVEFYRNNSQEVTGEGDAQRIFATVLNAIQKFIKKHQPWRLKFSASKTVESGQNSQSRAKLYDRLVQRYAGAWGYDMYLVDHGDQVTYELTQKKNVAENFTDGRVKGKSRPGRVKRAGASCAGSVTDLRARAKKYSGERAKMYHWCANMKSGKKK